MKQVFLNCRQNTWKVPVTKLIFTNVAKSPSVQWSVVPSVNFSFCASLNSPPYKHSFYKKYFDTLPTSFFLLSLNLPILPNHSIWFLNSFSFRNQCFTQCIKKNSNSKIPWIPELWTQNNMQNMLKVNKIKILEWTCSGVFIVNFEHISHILVFLLLKNLYYTESSQLSIDLLCKYSFYMIQVFSEMYFRIDYSIVTEKL